MSSFQEEIKAIKELYDATDGLYHYKSFAFFFFQIYMPATSITSIPRKNLCQIAERLTESVATNDLITSPHMAVFMRPHMLHLKQLHVAVLMQTQDDRNKIE